MNVYIILVEHQQYGKRYLFDCTGLKDIIKRGDTVICETIRGETTGVAVTEPIQVVASDGALGSLFRQCGAYLPIKRIFGVVRPRELTDDEKERIAWEWLREQLDSNDLSF